MVDCIKCDGTMGDPITIAAKTMIICQKCGATQDKVE